jgi:uracil phosphoribosyltransferase
MSSLDAPQMPLSPSQMELVQLGDLRFLRPSLELKHLYTIIRNRETSRSDFIFFSDRIIRLLIEEALTLVPFERRSVITPTAETYEGLTFSKKIAGVSIVRAGESMEKGLREVVRDIRIGKILIQRDEITATPKLFYSKLPADIATRFVFLLDPMLATGGSANKAIDVLLEHGVEESKIYFVNMVCSFFHTA